MCRGAGKLFRLKGGLVLRRFLKLSSIPAKASFFTAGQIAWSMARFPFLVGNRLCHEPGWNRDGHVQAHRTSELYQCVESGLGVGSGGVGGAGSVEALDLGNTMNSEARAGSRYCLANALSSAGVMLSMSL